MIVSAQKSKMANLLKKEFIALSIITFLLFFFVGIKTGETIVENKLKEIKNEEREQKKIILDKIMEKLAQKRGK